MQEISFPPDAVDDYTREPNNSYLKLASTYEARSQRDIEAISRLQAEVIELQKELEITRNEVRRYEMLLRNAMQREIELKAQLSSNQN